MKYMKLKDIINYLDKLSDVIIWVDDDNTAPAFEGVVFDIPWIYLDYYLDNSSDDTEAISARKYNDEDAGFVILLTEKEN